MKKKNGQIHNYESGHFYNFSLLPKIPFYFNPTGFSVNISASSPLATWPKQPPAVCPISQLV